jgi:ribosomal protein S27AE
MEANGHKPILRGTRYVCANCGDFLLDVRTSARLKAMADVDPVKKAAVMRRMLRDPKLAKRLVEKDPRKVVATYKLADKFNDFLMNPQARPDLQTPEAQSFLQTLQGGSVGQNSYLNDKTDEMMPWLTREWKKGRVRTDPQMSDVVQFQSSPDYEYEDTNGDTTNWHILRPDELNHWADWYRSDHPSRKGKDIMQMKAPEMHQTIRDWDADMKAKAGEAAQVRGDVVHHYPDGWTVQKLNSEKALKDEGDSMGHCVGGYWPGVQQGNTLIYSLRDHHNEPHATWEITPRQHECPKCGEVTAEHHAPLGSGDPHVDCGYQGSTVPSPQQGNLEQIQGKANEPPVPEYQQRIKDYMESAYPDKNDRPYWDDLDISDMDELDPDYGGYVAYHPGDYGLNKPDIDFDWGSILSTAREYDRYPDRLVEMAQEYNELPTLAAEAERFSASAEEEAEQRAWDDWIQRGEREAEMEWEEEAAFRFPYPEEPDSDDYETQEEYDDAFHEFEEAFADIEREREENKDRFFEERRNDHLEAEKEADPELEWSNDLDYAIQSAKRASRTSAAPHSHPRFIIGEPCNCTFIKHLQELPRWHIGTTMVCEACGDPLEHGKCQRCDWGVFNNAPDPSQPLSDQTKEVKPGIQA